MTKISTQARPAWMDQSDEVMSDMGAASPPRISLAASGSIILKHDGKEEVLPGSTMFVILKTYPGAQYVNFRNFWEKKYDKVASGPPDCCSNNGMVPNSWAPAPQSASCKGCPQDVKGTGGTEKSRACKSTKQLCLVRADDLSGVQMVYSVPATALRGLYSYYRELHETMKASESQVKTIISPNPEVHEFITPVFSFGGYLDSLEDNNLCLATHKKLADSEADYLSEIKPLPTPESAKQLTQATNSVSPYPGQVAPPATTDIEAPVEKPGLIDISNLASASAAAEEISAIAQLLQDISQVTDVTTLRTYLNSEVAKEIFAVCTPEEQKSVQPAAAAKAKELAELAADPAKQAQFLFQNITTKEQLPELLTTIKKCDKLGIQAFKDAFIRVASKLNGGVFDLNAHGTSRSPLTGYPSISKGGAFNKKRTTAAAAVSAQPSALQMPSAGVAPPAAPQMGQIGAVQAQVSQPAEPVAALADILADLDPA